MQKSSKVVIGLIVFAVAAAGVMAYQDHQRREAEIAASNKKVEIARKNREQKLENLKRFNYEEAKRAEYRQMKRDAKALHRRVEAEINDLDFN